MGLTLPQAKRLAKSLADWPPIDVLAPMAMALIAEKSGESQASTIERMAETVKGGDFLKSLGAET